MGDWLEPADASSDSRARRRAPAEASDDATRGSIALSMPATRVLWIRPGLAPGQFNLGRRPGRTLASLAVLWILGSTGLGVGAYQLTHGGPRPLHIHLPRVSAAAAMLLPTIHWARTRPQPAPSIRRTPKDGLERAERLGLGARVVANELLRGKVHPSWVAEAESLGATPTSFAWPAQGGWFVRGYGSGEDGYHLAVDVGAEEGSAVLAAADGIVAYADDDVRGYGNLLMLVHGGGFVTMYAHNRTHSVAAGDVVKAGDPIGTVGSTGISRGPHVHFELMHDRMNCDPVPLFTEGIRHRGRNFVSPAERPWVGAKPPRGVACEKRRRHPRSRWHHH